MAFGMMLLLIPFVGLIVGTKYFFTKNRRKYGCLLFCLGVVSIIILGTSGTDESKVSEPTMTPEEIKAEAVDIEYDPLYRNIETHTGKIVHLSGKAVQIIIKGGNRYDLRLAVDGDYDQMIYVTYRGDRVLENDTVEVWGRVKGLHSYKSVLGARITIPAINSLIGVVNHTDDASSPEQAETEIARTQGQTAAPAKAASEVKPPPTAPIIFSGEQASAFLLKPDDFPKNWTAKKNGMIAGASTYWRLDAQNDYLTDYDAKMIKITLATHETEAGAQTAFSDKKAEAQATIDESGISGYKLEDVKKYPLFVWNASSQPSISGVEKWTVIGVYGNITVKVYHEGSVGAPKKGFAVDIAKKQIDSIKGD